MICEDFEPDSKVLFQDKTLEEESEKMLRGQNLVELLKLQEEIEMNLRTCQEL